VIAPAESAPGPARSRTGFTEVDYPEPHRERGRRILESHPEMRELFGREPRSAALIVGLVLFQLAVAWLLRSAPWWQVLAVSWLVGAFANHTLWVLVHECTHDLVVHGKTGNRLLAMLANVPLVIPSSESFRLCHLRHHRFQGDYTQDIDVPSAWEARLIGNSPWGKFLWQLFFWVFQGLRVQRMARHSRTSLVTGWSVFNFVVIMTTNVLVWVLMGPGAFAYIALSFVFSIGPHPVGARWIQEHYLTDDSLQETRSYYGRLNWVALNVGHHNEHHDFPFVSWNRLPRVRALVPEVYDHLHFYRSWTRLWFRFLFDRNITLASRVTRDGTINARRPQEAAAPGS
jgi:sphingolipid delta-4 desaturase